MGCYSFYTSLFNIKSSSQGSILTILIRKFVRELLGKHLHVVHLLALIKVPPHGGGQLWVEHPGVKLQSKSKHFTWVKLAGADLCGHRQFSRRLEVGVVSGLVTQTGLCWCLCPLLTPHLARGCSMLNLSQCRHLASLGGCWAGAAVSPAAPLLSPHLLTSWSRRRLRRLISRVVTLNTLMAIATVEN